MNKITLFIIILTIGCISISCNDDVAVGANIVGSQPIMADFNDDVVITAKTVEAITPLISYRNRADFERNPYLLGALDDPNFGKTSSTVFVTPRVSNTILPDFNNSIIDSVVLVIPLDTLGTYGDETAIHSVSVHRLIEPVDLAAVDTLFASECLEFEDTPIVQQDINPFAFDSVVIVNPATDTLTSVIPQLRFELDKDLWQEVLRDTLNTEGTQNLVNQVNGYAIKSEPNSSSMFGVNLLSTSVASIEIFYTDSISSIYNLDISSTTFSSSDDRSETSIKHSCLVSDYVGSGVESVLGDSLAEFNYMEGLEGFNIEYNLSNVIDLDADFINYAVLELFILEDDSEPIEQVLCMFQNDEGEFFNILDFSVENLRSIYFDGALDEVEIDGQTLKKYEIIMTNHIINLRNGNIESPYVYIRPFSRAVPNHSIIYGPNHPTFPAKLKLITTKP